MVAAAAAGGGGSGGSGMAVEAPAHKRAHDMLERALSERAQRVFLLTDLERKGFIVKRDMQRMRSEVPLAPEQLEAVFDSLDVQGNGYLTIEQFLEGFGQFLSSHCATNGSGAGAAAAAAAAERAVAAAAAAAAADSLEDVYSGEDSGISLQTQEDEDEQLEMLLHQLSATGALHSVEVLRQLSRRVQREGGAQLQANLEAFLRQLAIELGRRQRDHWELERTLRLREDEHNKQVQRLFEEMEAQLAEDKENLVRQEEEKLRLSRRGLEEELAQRNRALSELLAEHSELSDQLREARAREAAARQENQQLARGKDDTELRLSQQRREVVRLRQNLEDVQQSKESDRRKNLSIGFRLARSIMLEQQGLLQQLQLVRGMVATLDEDNNKTWRSSDDKSRLQDVSYTSLESTSGVLDEYEYDEDYCHPVFQKPELLRTSGTQTALSYSSGTSSLQEELESSKSSECDFSNRQTIA